MWRRVAGGLNAALQQVAATTACGRRCCRARARPASSRTPNELAEMWRAAASLERLDVEAQGGAGRRAAQAAEAQPGADLRLLVADAAGGAGADLRPAQRGGASADGGDAGWTRSSASSRATTSERLALGVLPGAAGPPHRPARPGRGRQPSAERADGAARPDVPEHWVRMVEEVTELEQEEQGQMLGDSLPIGLRLLKPEEGI